MDETDEEFEVQQIPTFPGSSLSVFYEFDLSGPLEAFRESGEIDDERTGGDGRLEGGGEEEDEDEEEDDEEDEDGDAAEAEPAPPLLRPSAGGNIEPEGNAEQLDEFGFRTISDPGLQDALDLREQPPIFDEIGADRYMKLCRSLGVTPINRFTRELNEGVVDLKFYGVSPRAIRAMSDALMYNPMVHTLDLTGNWLSASSCYYLSELLLRENNALRNVILRRCNLRAEGAALLAEGVELNCSVQVLDLAHNNIGDEGVQALQSAFTLNEELLEVDLSGNELGAVAAASLAKAMRENVSLRALRLARNNLYENTPKGLRLLLRALQTREDFQLIDLAWNALNKDAAVPIRAFLVKSPSVREVHLDHNRFPSSAVDIIKVGVAKSSSLEYVSLGCNPMEPDSAMNLLRACQTSQTVRILDLEGIRVNKEFLPLKAKLEEQRQMTINIEGALSDYEIKGPNLGEMMLKRARYEGFKPKKKKKKKDFGHLLLQMANDGIESVPPDQFTEMARKKKKKKIRVREELLRALYEQFEGRKGHVDVSAMLKCYMQLFPETQLPPTRPKKQKKKKKKKKRTKKSKVTKTK